MGDPAPAMPDPSLTLDTGFRPSVHGFGFPNRWHDTLLGVVPSRGRCGGMVYVALDHFLAGEALPPRARDREMPAYDLHLAHRIWIRQLASVVAGRGANAARFLAYTLMPDGAPGGVARESRRALVPLFDGLAAGRPVPLGLIDGPGPVRPGRNHQVLAYAATFTEATAVIRIYDPNLPLRDDVSLEVSIGSHELLLERAGRYERVWRGLFVERYVPPPS